MIRRFHILLTLVAAGLAAWMVASCEKTSTPDTPPQKQPSAIDFDQVPYETLSDYGFFVGDPAEHVPNDGVVLYEPSASLFTDYAHKKRYVWMPEGEQATILDDAWEQIDFPDQTAIIKTFYYPKDASRPEEDWDIIETRLLIKRHGEWEAFPYRWNEDQTDAELKVVGGTYPVTFTDADGETHSIDYIQPNKNQCKSCHNQDEKLMPIGPKARNLNWEIEYPDGTRANQLERWNDLGLLANFTSTSDVTAVVNHADATADLHLRAMSYLDGNCGHCHNAKGPASTSGLFLTYEQDDPRTLGVWKTPVAAGAGAGTHTFDVYPGKADSSILVYRMNSIETGVMMAEIGRVMIHDEGVDLISQWIDQMEVES